MSRRNSSLIILLLFTLYSHISLAKIDIEIKEADLGKIIQGKPINYVFLLKNQGNKTLNIKKITPD